MIVKALDNTRDLEVWVDHCRSMFFPAGSDKETAVKSYLDFYFSEDKYSLSKLNTEQPKIGTGQAFKVVFNNLND